MCCAGKEQNEGVEQRSHQIICRDERLAVGVDADAVYVVRMRVGKHPSAARGEGSLRYRNLSQRKRSRRRPSGKG